MEWASDAAGWKLSVPRKKTDQQFSEKSGCIALVFGFFWIVPLAFGRAIFVAWRRFQIRGNVEISNRILRSRNSALFQRGEYEWSTNDMLLLEPVVVRTRDFIGTTKRCHAYRLAVLPSSAMGDVDASIEEVWRAQLKRLEASERKLPGLCGQLRAGERWLQTFLHLEMALGVANKVSALSGVPLVDCTREPEALIETVDESPYAPESVGSVSLAASVEQGAISIPGSETFADEIATTSQVRTPSEVVPGRVRIIRQHGSADIRMSYMTVFRAMKGINYIFGLLLGLWITKVLVGGMFRESLGLAVLYGLIQLGVLGPSWRLFIKLRNMWSRSVWLRLDQDQIEVLNSLSKQSKRCSDRCLWH